jgi:EmrB/QacA subfamily drug resistance transporter
MWGTSRSVKPKSRRSPYIALLPVFAGVFIAADDQTVVVTVLPQIIVDMGVLPTELDRASWTITGYLLGYLAAMPLIGRVSDVWGHRRLFAISTVAFMAGSAAVALTPTLGWLIAARVFQAIGAGALVPISIAIAGDLFPAGRRAVAYGLIGASAEAGGVIGPLWGGLIIRYLDWRWVFWMNIPMAAVVLLAVVVLVPPSPRHKLRVDYVGGALIAIGLASLTLGLDRIDSAGAPMAGYMALAVLALVLFVVRQMRVEYPLLPVSMFRGWAFSAANSTHLLVGASLIIGMVTIPLMANTALGLTPLEGGLRLMRLTAAIPVGAVLGGILCQRLDVRVAALAGLVLTALGFLLMSRWDLDIADPALTLHLATAGLGFGLLIAPIALAATESVGEEDRGAAAAMVSATRIVGMTFGLAALTAWGSERFRDIAPAAQWPFQLAEETAAQFTQRLADYEAQLRETGMTLFGEFFLIAMGVCIVALLPAALMAWRRRQ